MIYKGVAIVRFLSAHNNLEEPENYIRKMCKIAIIPQHRKDQFALPSVLSRLLLSYLTHMLRFSFVKDFQLPPSVFRSHCCILCFLPYFKKVQPRDSICHYL